MHAWPMIILVATACCAVLLLAMFVRSLFRARDGVRLLRAHRRLRGGRCPACGYDLTGNTSGTCPECGKAVTA